MTSIQFSSAHSSGLSASEPATFKTVLIHFKEDVQAHFDQQDLIQGCAFFKGALRNGFNERVNSLVEIPYISYPVFKALFRFLCKGETLSEAIEEQDLTPRFYEDFMEALNFLNPLEEPAPETESTEDSPAKKLRNQVEEAFPYLVTFEQAKTISAIFRAEGDSLSPLLPNSSSSTVFSKNEIPFLVKVANAILFHAATLPTKKAASETFRQMREAKIRKELADRAVAISSPQAASSSSADAPWEAELEKFQEAQLVEESTLLSDHAWKKYSSCTHDLPVAVEALPTKMKIFCSSYLNDDEPLIQEMAKLAKRCLLQEGDKTIASLLLCNIDLSHNPELLEHLVGPKAYLLDHYNIKVVTEVAGYMEARPDPRLPFRINGTPWAFDVNQSLKAFEDEIRQDLELMGCKLDARIIEERDQDAPQPVKKVVQENVAAQALHEFKVQKSTPPLIRLTPLNYAKAKKSFLTGACFRSAGYGGYGGDEGWSVEGCLKELNASYQHVLNPPPLRNKTSFTVGVKLLSSKTFSVAINSTDTVADLKQRIFEREGIPPQRQNLMVMGKLLQPATRDLREYNLKPGDMVYVTAGVRG